MTGESIFRQQKERIRKRFLKYTRKAFRMLPKLDRPVILDIGCGSGIPTIELARLSNGDVTGIDIDKDSLDTLNKNIEKAGLSTKVKALHCSISSMEFPEGSFDIIWSEGSIYSVGFEKGLQEWKRFLKPEGFMVVHDEKGDIENKIEQISACGYELLGYFIISDNIWWDEYFAPLQKLIKDYRERNVVDSVMPEDLRTARQEIDMFIQNPQRNNSVFFVMKRQ